jgi:hypothetical protein
MSGYNQPRNLFQTTLAGTTRLVNLEQRLKEVAKPQPRNREPLVVFISPVAQQKDKKGRLVATLSRGDCVYFRYSADPGIAR